MVGFRLGTNIFVDNVQGNWTGVWRQEVMLGGNHLATNIYFWTISRRVLVGFRQGTNIFVDNVQEGGHRRVLA